MYGNALTAIAGFALASAHHFYAAAFVGMLIGISLVMASACVCNNYLDRGIDRHMARTKNRALVQGDVSGRAALIYAAVLGLAGFLSLILLTNLLTTIIAAGGFLAYVVIYGIGKRRTVHGTVIGSISGAVPPVVGYCAVSNHFDTAALILFLILVCWQMPHFYAIAMYRSKDYAAAGIPVLPVKQGTRITKIQILLYISAFIIVTATLKFYGYAGYPYLVVMLIAGVAWLGFGLKGFRRSDDIRWARQMFFFSLIVLTTFCLIIPIDVIIRALA